VGLANTFELQQARTNLLRAESQLIQAKYSYVLDLKILDFYQGKPISLQ
jgi:outer membrane protein